MTKKIFEFLTQTVFGLFMVVNFFFVMGLIAGSGSKVEPSNFAVFIAGFLWFFGNVGLVVLSIKSKPASVPQTGTGGGGVIDNDGDHEPNPNEEMQT